MQIVALRRESPQLRANSGSFGSLIDFFFFFFTISAGVHEIGSLYRRHRRVRYFWGQRNRIFCLLSVSVSVSPSHGMQPRILWSAREAPKCPGSFSAIDFLPVSQSRGSARKARDARADRLRSCVASA